MNSAAQQLFWAEVRSKDANRRSLAVCYALLISQHAGEGGDFWRPINTALNLTLGLATNRQIDAFRKVAWAIHDAAATAITPTPDIEYLAESRVGMEQVQS